MAHLKRSKVNNLLTYFLLVSLCTSVSVQEPNVTMVMRDGVFSLSIAPSAFILEDTLTILRITITIDNAVHPDESVYVVEEDVPSTISVSYSVSA